MAETLTVEFRILGVERIYAGRLVALACAEIELAGVPIVLQGIRVLRDESRGLTVLAPAFRAGDGEWRSAVVLPDSLRDALGAEVLDHVRERGLV